ncbi:hypothetical protein [Nocardia sp. NRRL S-836]|uniref:terpene synthase family protein n=1 Tax=Nocardia sp. NRRL S-836 TaxID=1519492 RepID=UPI000B24FCB5|nr:hypothetical protein [Nocardia sp. NRRL S-836]
MVEVPTFDMPYAARLSPHVDRVRQRSRTWARNMGMFTGIPWTEAFYDTADYGGFMPLTFPALAQDELQYVNDWGVWGFYVDDAFLDGFLRTRDLVGGKAFVARLKAVLTNPSATPLHPAERGLADLLSRGTPDEADRTLLLDHLDALLWELHNTVQGRVPDPIDLVEMRRKSVMGELSARLVRKAARADLPEELLRNSTMRALVDSFGDVPALRTDIYNFDRVHATGGSTASAVLAVRQFFDCELQQAVGVVGDLISARLRQIGAIMAELPALAAEYDLDAQAKAGLSRYAEAMRSWLAGELLWTQRSGRYRSSPTPTRRSFHAPSGLGTAAVLVR